MYPKRTFNSMEILNYDKKIKNHCSMKFYKIVQCYKANIAGPVYWIDITNL